MRLALLVLLLSLLAPRLAAGASMEFFTDRSSFTAQTARFTTETFNTARADRSFAQGSLAFDGFRVEHRGTLGRPFIRLDVPPASDPHTSIDGSPFLYAGLGEDDEIRFLFDAPIMAFAADFAGVDDDQTRAVEIAAGAGGNIPFQVAQRISFFGLISGAPFTEITLSGGPGADLGIGIDNISFGAAMPTVPLPSGITLYLSLLAAFGLLGWYRAKA
ncbi:MAG: hypothetical protein AAGI13_11425 [Pseudomonadota bacterium]